MRVWIPESRKKIKLTLKGRVLLRLLLLPERQHEWAAILRARLPWLVERHPYFAHRLIKPVASGLARASRMVVGWIGRLG